jgi:DnaJ-class molecular chaperone
MDKIKIEMNLVDCPDCKGTGKASEWFSDTLSKFVGIHTKKYCKRCKGIGKIKIR